MLVLNILLSENLISYLTGYPEKGSGMYWDKLLFIPLAYGYC